MKNYKYFMVIDRVRLVNLFIVFWHNYKVLILCCMSRGVVSSWKNGKGKEYEKDKCGEVVDRNGEQSRHNSANLN